MLEVIHAIQKAKSVLGAPQAPSPQERQLWCEKIAEEIRTHRDEVIDSENSSQNFSTEFLQEMSVESSALAFARAAKDLAANGNSHREFRPTGLVSLILPKILSFRALCERLAPALAAGDAVLVKTSSASKKTGDIIKKILSAAKVPEGYVQVLNGTGQEIGPLLTQHPAIKAISFVGRATTAEKILAFPGIAHKKLQFSLSGNSSAILLGSTWSEAQIDCLLKSCFEGSGCLPWNTTKIFVAEIAQDDFLKTFLPRASLLRCSLPSEEQALLLEQKIQALKKEGAKVLCGGKRDGSQFPATVLLDLPHCSEAQQLEMQGPVVLVSSVKYPHEAVKWNNTGDLAYSTLILGDEDKALRLSEKLESGTVLINRWAQASDGVLRGGQQSNIGIMDFEVFGDFYSDRKNIVTAGVKTLTSN
jgi:aminomuconate-semialdehyde/2-hydroxymuconate-6-semialdehyde dehydrogenase